MTSQRKFSLVVSTVLAAALGLFLLKGSIDMDGRLAYFIHIILFFYFLAVLVSNQQYEEDFAARIERMASSALISFIFFFQMIYAPVARYLFGNMIQKAAFVSDTLALFFFLFFALIFIIATAAESSFSRTGFLSGWKFFNNPTAYFVLRNLWLAAVLLTIFLYWQNPFIIITA
ncbi:MAG: hypothetical protein A2359_04020 [Candidatus Moranbacteria bacterium RIFOXYB1_FULL_43_19]|nr:MAG: hypothetical protein A2184_04600 [Candidatus Moranbacteria bacterium RIFOXYA1_FULL_44_7]OGI27821.1 MAG: hypothetical protein A2359_04020 [Candidatus Moranbacteria bacterium RIFOXYB1_FULL_43_19]OGI34030.1 MAG: hypothetical protein A2420_02710 [Candidatus Moranbacteria bacterium RIFOXYC1_FULL_44_13]OGI37740.1 MAG: hypothetical protein A2612_03205 [Candidatus Moranbacteria bacterium RIFOXYD1_FULL_44_12]